MRSIRNRCCNSLQLRLSGIAVITFLPDEDQPGRNRVVILSHGLWQRRFGSNPGVMGQVVRLNGEDFTVVGVMSSSYRIDVYGGPLLWTPIIFPPESLLPAARGDRSLEVMARLKSGVSVETARAEMVAVAQRSEQAYPGTSKGWSASAMSIQHYIADEFEVGMRLQMGLVLFVLLIACVNIANLQLARGAERQREFAMRAALGASRFRMVRQLLVESLLIALAGGGLGLLLACWGVGLLRAGLSSIADNSAVAREVTIDHTVMIYTLGISALAAILFGLAPAVHQAQGVHSTLKEGGHGISQSKARQRTQSVLVTAEIALALVLVIAAGVFVQEFLDRVRADFGIDSNQVLTANISLSSTDADHKDASKQAAFFQEAIQHLEALPGVISAGATSTPPVGDYQQVVTFTIEGRPALLRTDRAGTSYFAISPDYLRTLGIPLIRGRNFSSSDGAQALPVALVNQEFVRRYFPNEEPIGKRIRLDTSGLDAPDWSEIVGVVGNVRDSFDRGKPVPQAYEPYRQKPCSAMTLVIRTRTDPAAFAPTFRRAVWEVDKDQPITAVQTMNKVMDQSGAPFRVVNIATGTFAGLGLALVAVGVFGVMAYAVVQRTHEIGIRMALGARRGDVLRMVVKKGMVLGAVGVGSGLALALPLTWLKFGLVNDEDLLPFGQRGPVFVAAVFVIYLAALLASYIPARRATRVDPAIALRHE